MAEVFLQNKYTKWYMKIIENAISRGWTKKTAPSYVERHHYIPKSMGGKKEHIVCLTAREHFVCHLLLTKMTVGKDKTKMCFALHRLIHGNNKIYCKSSLHYEYIKKINSKACKKRSKIWWNSFTSEEKSAMRSGEKNGRYGKEVSEKTRKLISKSNKGKLSGENHPLWKKGHSEKSKIKMSISKTGQGKGKKWFNNGIKEILDYPQNKPENFIEGRLEKFKIKLSTSNYKSALNKKWYNNGIIEVLLHPENKLNGFNLGRLKRVS